MSGHFEHDIHPESAGALGYDCTNIFFRWVERVVLVHFRRQLAAMFVHLDREDGSRADNAGNRDGEQSDGSAACDRDCLGCNFAGEHAVHCVAERIENGSVFLRNRGIEFPDIRFGDDHVLGKSAISIDADDLHVLADVSFAGAALQTLAAGYVHLSGNEIAFFHAGDFIAEGYYFAAELVSGDERRMNASLCPAVPLVNVKVSAADGGDFYLDQDIGAS